MAMRSASGRLASCAAVGGGGLRALALRPAGFAAAPACGLALSSWAAAGTTKKRRTAKTAAMIRMGPPYAQSRPILHLAGSRSYTNEDFSRPPVYADNGTARSKDHAQSAGA